MGGGVILQTVIALIAPRLLTYIVAAFLILFGLAGLFPHMMG